MSRYQTIFGVKNFPSTKTGLEKKNGSAQNDQTEAPLMHGNQHASGGLCNGLYPFA